MLYEAARLFNSLQSSGSECKVFACVFDVRSVAKASWKQRKELRVSSELDEFLPCSSGEFLKAFFFILPSFNKEKKYSRHAAASQRQPKYKKKIR